MFGIFQQQPYAFFNLLKESFGLRSLGFFLRLRLSSDVTAASSVHSGLNAIDKLPLARLRLNCDGNPANSRYSQSVHESGQAQSASGR